MTVIYTAHSSRRPPSTVFKIKSLKFRTRLVTSDRTKLSPKLMLKSEPVLYRISGWTNRWSLLHLVMMSICILIHYRSSSIDHNAVVIKSNSQVNNKTLIRREYLNWIHYDWCSLSSPFHNNTSSYTAIDQSVILLGVICCVMLIIGLLLYFNLNEKLTNHSSSHFWCGLLTLSMFAGSSICNQLISTLTCRPVEILYDKRYTSIVGVQMIGFIACVHFAYGLGRIFTPLFDQRRTTPSTYDSCAPLFPSMKKIR